MVLPENSMKYIQGDILEILADGGFERIGAALRILLNAAMLPSARNFLVLLRMSGRKQDVGRQTVSRIRR